VVDAVTPNAAREHFDVDYDFIAHLNGECLDWAGMDVEALQHELKAQGEDWYGLVRERCPHLFASAPLFISDLQLQQMQQVISAAEQALGESEKNTPLGVFYGYDFHLNAQGVHLIEINTNAGGALLNALLIKSQRTSNLYGEAVGEADPEQKFTDMFLNEWRLVHGGDRPLQTVAIVDERPQEQYLYPEFLLAKQLFERAGFTAFIADPAQLEARDEGLYCEGRRIDLIYNRLTDFDLSRYSHLREVSVQSQVLITPGPAHHAKYADKRKLAWLTDIAALRVAGVSEDAIRILQQGIPHTEIVSAEDSEHWWSNRKEWFFKPVSGYGSKGTYRGDKMTKRVFEEVMQADYIAQRLAVPGERKVCLGNESVSLKYDVRCYVYDGRIQLVAARLYQGQTTNFRTNGGGFALVRVVH
jgi:hypothetical protein